MLNKNGYELMAGSSGVEEDRYINIDKHIEIKISTIKECWEQYIKIGKIKDNKYLRPEILSSWKRSKERGLDAYEYKPVVISQEELKEKLEENRLLIEICMLLVNDYISSIKGTGFRVDIVDPDLVIIKQFGEEENIKIANDQGTFPGVYRKEEFVGANAPCLAAILGKPVQLVGPEHYKAPLQYWTCSAVPLFDKEGCLLGIVSLSGHYSKAHEHTLGMAIALGKAIEFCYYQNQIREEKELNTKYIEGIINTIADGIIATDNNGVIKMFNKTAGELFGVTPQKLIGRDIRKIFDGKSSIINTINTGKGYWDSELIFMKEKERTIVIGNIIPIKNTENNSDKRNGALAIFKSMKNVRGFVKNVAGLKAFFTFDDLIGNSPEFVQVKSLALQAAKLPSYILLQGESGTGKELFAQAIHNASNSCDGPFVAINCGAIPVDIIESELFGYEEGSFTGAKKGGQPGKLQLAEGGTLFLDEINSMPLNLQVKLLRVLQNKTFMRVGGIEEIQFRARVISASNKDLWEEVHKGSFREDLFYRLNVIVISLPPLRERKEDIVTLINYFTQKLSKRLNIDFHISKKAVEPLLAYDWPGNVRELENVIERSAVLAFSRGSRMVEEQDLENYPGFKTALPRFTCEELMGTLDTVEKDVIIKVLEIVNGNKSKAAKVLGITRKTLYKKIKKYSQENSSQLF